MADLTKDQLRQQNDSLFANNNSGNITAEDLRTFNDEMIDTIATENNPSFTGSVEVQGDVSASTYYGDGSNLTGVTSEVPSGTVSGSSQIDYPLISNIPSGIVSSSTQVEELLPSGVVSGSSQVSYPELSNIPSGIVSGSSQVVLEDTTYTDNGLDSFLQTDGAGNLSFQYVQSVYETIRNMTGAPLQKGTPVYISGSTGDNGNAYVAIASDETKMPATYVAGEDLGIGETGLALVSGKVSGVDTTGYPAGTMIYVGESGGWSDLRPSGSNSVVQLLGVVQKEGVGGQGVLINQLEAVLPNIQEGYAWVGDSGNQPVAVSTSSWDAHSDLTQLNLFTQSQEIYNAGINSYTQSTDITIGNIETYITSSSQRIDLIEDFTASQEELNATFATTGSNTFTGDQTIEGTNLGPGNTLQANDGNGTPILSVQNATLKGFTGVDVVINGNTTLDGTVAIDDATTINGNLENTGSFTNGGDTTIVGTNLAPGNTLTVNDGNSVPRLAVQNATLAGLTGTDVLVNGNAFFAGNINATGSLGIADNNFIISSGSNNVEFSAKFSDGQAGVVFNAPNNKFTANGNMNLQAIGGIFAVDAGFGINLNNNTTIDANGVVNGTNASPGQTFIAKDGNSTNRLEVNNATLSGLTSVDVNINGKTQITDTLTLQGDGVLNGTNASPGSTFIAKDGNSTNRLEVNNATLSGFTGVDVNLNGTVQITETLKMVAQDPLPSGVVGELAVSGSNLYFYNGAWTQVV